MKLAINVENLLNDEEISRISFAPKHGGLHFPTWYPIFEDKPRKVDCFTNRAMKIISNEPNGCQWLRSLKPRLTDIDNFEDAAAALAEARTYASFLEAGFNVNPLTPQSQPTPDFSVDCGDGPITVEVFAKHQDEAQREILDDVEAGLTPEGVEQQTIKLDGANLLIRTYVIQPAGSPDPNKPHDSVQANLISRLCAVKQNEAQLPNNQACLVVIDLTRFGPSAEFISMDHATPLMSGTNGLTSGGFWYAFYGWKGAPIFEDDFSLHERIVPMGHDGRFRLGGTKKSKLSGVILVGNGKCVLFENPWAVNRLPDRARKYCERLPWFDISLSVCDWVNGHATRQVEQGKEMIESLYGWHQKLNNLEGTE